MDTRRRRACWDRGYTTRTSSQFELGFPAFKPSPRGHTFNFLGNFLLYRILQKIVYKTTVTEFLDRTFLVRNIHFSESKPSIEF